MPVDHCVSATFARSSCTVDNGLASQVNAQPASGRKNLFDLVIAVANDRAAADFMNGTTAQASTAAFNELSSCSSARDLHSPKSESFDVESETGSIEEVDLHDWPTASRLAATNSDFAASRTSAPSQRQICHHSYAAKQSSSATATALAFQAQAQTGNIGFWAYFGL